MDEEEDDNGTKKRKKDDLARSLSKKSRSSALSTAEIPNVAVPSGALLSVNYLLQRLRLSRRKSNKGRYEVNV